MSIRKAVICASLALGAISLPAAAQISGSIIVDIPPPAPRVEVVPAPRPGYVWTNGYWRWEEPRRTHIWVEGRWEAERPGHRWHHHHWANRDNRYYYEPGRWERL